jgi:hypothetical protein
MGEKLIEVEGEDIAQVAAQIPRAETLEPGERVVVRPKARSILGKLLARPKAPLAVLGSALLARGYIDLLAEAAPNVGVSAAAPRET